MSTGCVFCERVAGRDFWIPVVQTRYSVAAVANHQRSTGSLIVIPRRHVLALHDLGDEEALDLFHTCRAAAAAVEGTYQPDGMYVWQGGRIPLAHIHVRICPRYADVPYTFAANCKLPLTPFPERWAIAGKLSRAIASGAAGGPRDIRGIVSPGWQSPATASSGPHPAGRHDGTCPVCEHVVGDGDGDGDWPQVAASAYSAALIPSRQHSPATTLVVPRRHVPRPGDLPEHEAADLWLLLRSLVGATMRALAPPSYHVSQYAGTITGEQLQHVAWRLEPRYHAPPEEYVDISSLPAVPVAERHRQAGMLRGHLPRPLARQDPSARPGEPGKGRRE